MLFLPPAQCQHGLTQWAAGVKRCDRQVYESTFTSPKTGVPRFDETRGFANVTGAAPGYAIATFACAATLDAGGASDRRSEDGLVGIDGEGHVVWHYPSHGVGAWDFTPDGHVVMVGELAMGAKRDEATDATTNETARWYGATMLKEVDARGRLHNQCVVDPSCWVFTAACPVSTRPRPVGRRR